MRLAPACVAAVLVISAFCTAQANHQKPCELTPEDYSVYTALLKGLGAPEDPEEAWANKDLLLEDATTILTETRSNWGGWGFRSKSTAAPSKETLTDLNTKGSTSCPLKPFGDTQTYRLIPHREIEGFFKKGTGDGWEKFYKKYPQAGGFWALSQPGYNEARNESVVYVSHSCGWLCGTGHLYFLTKEEGEWKVKNRLMLWIS